ncbi:MAG: DNA polymerase I [Myxococcota bacterium]
MPKKLLLVDAPNHAFRAYHAIQTDMRAPDGFPTRALFGFTRILLALVRDYKPDYVGFVFDTGKSFRNELYADYKGQRFDMPEDLRQQWGELRPLIEAFGYKVLAIPGTEADDVIGTLAVKCASEHVHVGIVSGDKDFCQLVGDHVHIVDLLKGVEVDRDGVIAKWGVPPEKIVELLSLMGDASDNVPGVPGVGEKKAAQFVTKYGDLEGVIAHAGEIGGKTGQAIAENADLVRLSRRLVTIKTDHDVDCMLDDLVPRPRDEAALAERLNRYNFKALMTELGLSAAPRRAVTHSDTSIVSLDCPAYWGPGPISALHQRLAKAGRVALHLHPDKRLDFAWLEDGHLHLARVPLDATQRRHVAPLLADPLLRKVGHDVKEQLKALGHLGGIDGDPMLADYLLLPELRHTLDELAKRHLDHVLGSTGSAGEEAQVVLRLEALLTERISESISVYRDIELPLVPILAAMELEGIHVDRDALTALSEELDKRLRVMVRDIHELAGEEFNVNSTQQLAHLLFEKLGLKGGKKTKTGWSTDADTLDKLDHPLPRAILAYRELFKLKGTYVDALPACVAADGRIHTNFRQAVAATGRLSSFEPNLQNIPIRSEEGRRIRKCFVAKPRHVFVSADYSQIELRILAHYCGEGPLVESFLAGEDIHRRTASEIFGVAKQLVTTEMRRAAKAINFGIVYGMGAFRLANDLRIPRAEAQSYIDGYFARYPQVRLYMESATARAREKGYAETLYGRRRPVQGLDAGNPMDRSAAERVAINTPIQGTAADLIKLAMIRVDAALRGTGAKMLLQVHDELVFEVPEAEVEDVRARVRTAMEGVAALRVPLQVETGAAATWDEAHS